MSDELDRDALIGLLDKLGEGDDQAVLAAAREISGRMAAAGRAWDEVLADWGAADAAPAEEADAEPEDKADDAAPAVPAGGDRDALAIIDKLLARSELNEITREELMGYKEDIAAGEFAEADRRYLGLLRARLSKRAK